MSIFNIRVYGLLIDEQERVLVTDEFRFGQEITKFPGGGLNWGEGPVDCLRREFREELDCEIDHINHFYTTDYFQPSAFHQNHQLISIYYQVKNITTIDSKISHNYELPRIEDSQIFRWVPIKELSGSMMTFPIDKIVADMLNKKR